jgi:two-component system chemotaxis sensor kinase CheA
MLPDSLSNKINTLASDLIMVDASSSAEDWREMAQSAQAIAEECAKEKLPAAADAAAEMSRLLQQLCDKTVPDPEKAIEHIHSLFSILERTERGEEIDDATRKETVARADLFLRDLEESQAVAAPEIEEEFMLEIEQRLDGLEQVLFSVSPGERDPETVRGVFREFHTLKGECGILGLMELNEFWHRAESAIENARHGKLELTEEVIDLLQQLTHIGRQLLKNEKTATKETIRSLQEKLAIAATKAQREAVAPKPETENPAADFFAIAEDAAEEVETVSSEEERPEEEASGERPVENGQMSTISVDVRHLDSLLELVGEVGLASSHLAHNPEIKKIRSIAQDISSLERTSRALHDMTANLRMTQVRPLFQRVQRAMLEAARARGKQVDIKIIGAKTLVDRIIIERLTAAMVHLARNAVDHGIESPAERRQLGKPERGMVILKASRNESDVMIELSEDGQGINHERIRNKAVELGLVKPEQEMTEREILNLIFSSGFSTASVVTGISGRGVGMSVVKESLDSLRGKIVIESKPGRGTRFMMRMPVALSAVDGLFVRTGGNVLVLPVSQVRESFLVRPDQINTISGKGMVVTIRGVVVPVLPLHQELGLPGKAKTVHEGVLVMVEDGDLLCAVLVDEVLETRQVVIRPLEGKLAQVPALTGAVLMPDRSVALMVDTGRLLKRVSVAGGRAFQEAGARQVSSERQIETVQIGSNQVGMIDFTVNCTVNGQTTEHAFAINAFKVREFVPIAEFTPLPKAPSGFVGILVLRDHTIPVLRLSELLGLVAPGKADKQDEQIVMVCEFAGHTVGFLVSKVSRVAYVSWNDIMPPPESGKLVKTEYIIGSIFLDRLREKKVDSQKEKSVAFVLDFELIVQKVIALYGDIGADLAGVEQRKTGNRILLAEDSALIRRQTAAVLNAAGMEVLEAENGQVAMNIVNEMLAEAQAAGASIFTKLDLVLSDIEMPQLDGYTLTAAIKRHPQLRVLPVILHSSITNDTMISRAREVGADGFVPKCDPKELADQLRKYL